MHKIAVSSFKGGTAKTSTSLHLGAALAKFHKQKVLAHRFRCSGQPDHRPWATIPMRKTAWRLFFKDKKKSKR